MIAPPIPESELEEIFQLTEPLWELMRGQRIFITGGTGFFGAWLLESFAYISKKLDLQAEATVLSRDPKAFIRKLPHLAGNSNIHLVQGDVRSFSFPEGRYRYVLHAATEASAKLLEEEPVEMLSAITAGTQRVLQFAVACGASRFLLTSSGAVYGVQPSDIECLSETYIGAPISTDARHVYAEGKRVSEALCAAYAAQFGLECAIARCWAFCGPHLRLDAHFAIGNFIGDAMAGRPIYINGDGTPTRSYLYAGDLAVWLWTMLFKAPSMEPYNVGSSESITIKELADTVRRVLNHHVPVEVARAPLANILQSRYVPSVEKAARELNIRSSISLEETIRRTAAWHGWNASKKEE